jgi:hypothetical protein
MLLQELKRSYRTPKLILNDDEKLRDDNDNIIELEFCMAERIWTSSYVSGSSVAASASNMWHHGDLVKGRTTVWRKGRKPQLLYTWPPGSSS